MQGLPPREFALVPMREGVEFAIGSSKIIPVFTIYFGIILLVVSVSCECMLPSEYLNNLGRLAGSDG